MQWHDYGYQHLTAETSAPSAHYHLDTPLPFVLQWPFVWYAGHGHSETNKQSIASKCGATGGTYPAHNRPIFGRSQVLIFGSREIPFPR